MCAGTGFTFCRILPLHPSTNVKFASNTTGESSFPFTSPAPHARPHLGEHPAGYRLALPLALEHGDGERDTTDRFLRGRAWNMSDGSPRPRRTGVYLRWGAGGGSPARLDDELSGKEASLPQLDERKNEDVEKFEGDSGILRLLFFFFFLNFFLENL
jgi:hypothetical protein